MSEDKVYKDGDVVWVKLGNSWWPGEVIGDEKRLLDDVHQLKKRPYCVVKFFQEDAYEYPKTSKQVYPFQCTKKNEFIKKGLALFNAKKSFMEKFPDDVRHAENLTKPATTTRIINERPGGLVKEMWGHDLTQRLTDYYENSQAATSGDIGMDSDYYASSRRDSVTTILNITPNRSSISSTPNTTLSTSARSARTLSSSSSASITPNTTTSSQYRCNLCNFTTMRQNVLIMHRKSHNSSGKGPNKILTSSKQSSQSVPEEEHSSVSTTIVDENVSTSITDTTGTPVTTKALDNISTVDLKSEEEKNVESTSRTRKRGSATPSPKAFASSKRTLRNMRAAQTTSPNEIEHTSKSKIETTLSPADNGTIVPKLQSTGAVSPTDSKNSEQIRQRLLADWSDEDKDENHEDAVPSTSRRNKSANTLQLPSTNSPISSIKRRSPTIVSMKTLEGAGQTLVVAAATQPNASQDVNIKTTPPRIRNIPKKDRLRDFGNRISASDEQTKLPEISADVTTSVIASSIVEASTTEKSAAISETSLNTTATKIAETEPIAYTANVPTAEKLSCFDFQEDEEEHENDVLKSIANYKKKYFSPDKDKSLIQSTITSAINESDQPKKICSIEQRDKELSAEIDSLLEQTTLVTSNFREDIVAPVSVKGLPIKERGKRIFKSRNRARIDNDDVVRTTVDTVVKKPIEALEKNTNAVDFVDEIKQETNTTVSESVSPSLSERKARGGGKRTRGKIEPKDEKKTRSPVNGNAERNKTPENVSVECLTLETEPAVQSVTEMIYVSQRSRRKPYNHRIMRQLIEEEETSIPFIRHSPVEIYSCDSSMDNGTHVVRGRRSKTTTPNSDHRIPEDNINGTSRTSSRNMNVAPLTPTDETSSLGVSDAGAEFGSPASSLDEERILTPVQDLADNQHDNEFKPIKERKSYDEIRSDVGDNHDVENTAENVEEDEEIESPPHEALSGNELEDHEIKEGNKRLKKPKKNQKAKEEEQQEQEAIADSIEIMNKNVAKRKSRTGTPSPNVGDDLPKKLMCDVEQQQVKESSEELQETERTTPTSTMRGSPLDADLKQKSRKNRSTPIGVLSRHGTKLEDELLPVTSKSPNDKIENAERTNVATILADDEKVPSPNQANFESTVIDVEASPSETTRTTPQQRKLKAARRSKTPGLENENEKLPEEKAPEIKSSEESSKSEELILQTTSETPRLICEEHLENNKHFQMTPDGKKDLVAHKPTLGVEAVPEKSVEKQVEAETETKIVENANCMNDNNVLLEKLSSSEKPLSNCTPPYSPVKESIIRDSPLAMDKNSSMESGNKSDKNSSLSSTKKYTRWDSPHSSDKKNLYIDSLPKSDKKSSQTDDQNISDRIITRWDYLPSSDKNPSRTDSPQGPAKKFSRWDSPLLIERKKKTEDAKSTTKPIEELNVSIRGHVTQTTDDDLKVQSIDSPIVTKVDGNGTTEISELRFLSPLTNISTTEAPPTVDDVTTPTTSAITSPTVEKVRINVDVANPLSTQIANILAASGNSSIHQQQQLRNKSPKSNINSPLKRKHSFEESETDGDAVVAHMQSLCPQVKITRKERIITPADESIISSPKKSTTTSSNTASHYDFSQMPIVISNEQILTTKKSPRANSALSVSNLWQTDLLQPPTTTTTMTTTTTIIPAAIDHQTPSGTSSPEETKVFSSSTERSRLSLVSRSSLSPSPQKSTSPSASTGGRKLAGNTVTLPSSITVKQHPQKFAEALALADSVLGPRVKPTKRRSSQTTPASTSENISNITSTSRRLNSAPALDVRSTPPAKIPKIVSEVETPISPGPPAKVNTESSTLGKSWSQSQSHRQAQKQKKLDLPNETVLESEVETIPLPATSPSPTKVTTTEDNQNVSDVELNNTAKITAVPIQPIPGYAETFLLCMLVDNMYKPINNIPHYLNTDLNQLVPVPPEAYEGMLPELAVDQPPAASADIETTLSGRMSEHQQKHQMNASNQQQLQYQQRSVGDKTESFMGMRELGTESSICSDGSTAEEIGLKLVLQSGETGFVDSTASSVDADISDGTIENSTDNAIVLNLENQQIILDSATFEQLLANPDANTQLVTDDGTEFVLTREVLTALKAQHDGQNVELLAIPAEQQQLQEQLIVAGGITEAGSSTDLLSVALANSEFYGNDVLQIETTLGGVVGSAAGLQLLASDGSIVFQAPPLPQAHLTPPITAHTSETNAVLNQTPIMSTLEKPSTAVVGVKCGIESSTSAVVSAVECNVSGMRRNLDDSLAVIGVSTQSSTVPTSLELPITITNPAIAPKVTMAQSAHAADLVQFQPHRSVATASAAVAAAAAAAAHMYDDPIEGIN